MAAVKYWYRTGISLLGLLLAASVYPAEGDAAALEQRLLHTDGVIANFTQQITDAQGYLVEQASGTLHLAKPRFRWEVLEPFPQIILAEGGSLQIYDPDLEQVTEREVDGAVDEAPLALLTLEELDLAEHFTVSAEPVNEQSLRYTLKPLSVDALFERLEMVFAGDALQTLLILDHTGQQTLIRFTDYQSGQVIQSDSFKLDYPPGTDFVRG